MIKAVIFDFAGVIGTEAYQLWLKRNIPNLKGREDFFMDISYKVDSTAISPSQFLDYLSKESNIKPDQIKQDMLSMFVLNKEVFDLIKKLKENYKTGLLSNFIASWLRNLLIKFKLKELFDAKVISTEHKMIKPDPKIFQLMLKKLKCKPEEAVFIDDRESNVIGAENVGIKGIFFKNAKDLKTNLKKLDIKI